MPSHAIAVTYANHVIVHSFDFLFLSRVTVPKEFDDRRLEK